MLHAYCRAYRIGTSGSLIFGGFERVTLYGFGYGSLYGHDFACAKFASGGEVILYATKGGLSGPLSFLFSTSCEVGFAILYNLDGVSTGFVGDQATFL